MTPLYHREASWSFLVLLARVNVAYEYYFSSHVGVVLCQTVCGDSFYTWIFYDDKNTLKIGHYRGTAFRLGGGLMWSWNSGSNNVKNEKGKIYGGNITVNAMIGDSGYGFNVKLIPFKFTRDDGLSLSIDCGCLDILSCIWEGLGEGIVMATLLNVGITFSKSFAICRDKIVF